MLSCWLVVAATIHRYPSDSVIGLAILAAGLPVYCLWLRAEAGVSAPFSEYMEWAKTRSAGPLQPGVERARGLPLAELGARLEDLEICGDSYYGYPPLQERLARKAGVDPDRVVHATGTSMANLLVLAAAASPGDEVLIEEPTYTLLVDAARWLRLEVRRFPRRAEAGFRLDPREVERALTPAHAARRAHEPPQPLERLHRRPRTCAGSAMPRARGRARAGGRGVPRGHAVSDGPGARPRGSGSEFVMTSAYKAYGLSGLRCGWIVAEPDLARRMWRLNDLFGVIPAHPAERLSVVALDRLDSVAERARRILEPNTRA